MIFLFILITTNPTRVAHSSYLHEKQALIYDKSMLVFYISIYKYSQITHFLTTKESTCSVYDIHLESLIRNF